MRLQAASMSLQIYRRRLVAKVNQGERPRRARKASVRLRDAVHNVGNDPDTSSLANCHCAIETALPPRSRRFSWISCELGSWDRKKSSPAPGTNCELDSLSV